MIIYYIYNIITNIYFLQFTFFLAILKTKFCIYHHSKPLFKYLRRYQSSNYVQPHLTLQEEESGSSCGSMTAGVGGTCGGCIPQKPPLRKAWSANRHVGAPLELVRNAESGLDTDPQGQDCILSRSLRGSMPINAEKHCIRFPRNHWC